MNLFELAAVLTLDKSGYDSGLDDAEQEASGLGSKLSKGLGNVGKVTAGVVATVGAGTVKLTKDILSASSEVGSLGDHIDKQSQKLGMSSQAYQEWDFILTHCGASVDSLQSSMKTMSTQAQKNAEEFTALGISQEELGQLSTEELFSRVVEGLQNMEAGTERTALATKLLGRGATELAPLLNQSADEVDSMRQQAHDLNKVLSDEAVKAGASYEDSLYNMQTAMSGMKNKATAELLPSLVTVMDGMAGVFSGDTGAVSLVSEGITSFIDKISEMIPQIAETAGTIITTLGDALVKNLPKLTQSAGKMIKTMIKALSKIFPQLVDMGLDIILTLVDAILDSLPELINGIITLVIKIVERLPEIITRLVAAIPKVIKLLIQGLMDNLPQIIQGLIQLVLAIVQALPEIIMELIQAIPEIISMLITGFLNAIPQLVQGAIQLVMGLVTHIPEIIKGLIEAIPDILKNILSAFGPLGEMLGGLFGNVLGICGDVLGGLIDVAGGILGEVGNVAQGVFNWIGTLMTDPAQALKDAFNGIKDYAVKVFESVKQIITGIFDLISAKQAEAEAKARHEEVHSQLESLEKQGLIVQNADGSYTSFSNKADADAYIAKQNGTVDVTGTVTVKGVNNKGEFVEAADYTMSNLKKDTRLYGAGG